MNQRFIVMRRETGERCLYWEFHVCEGEVAVKQVVANVTARGVIQYSTYPIGKQVHYFDNKVPTAKVEGLEEVALTMRSL